ncbi:hypothetical protein [Burkholderia plantarii]|uniref:hypothetical protein n=1 Tax=Burkholderia plantarii TaxID=41899 RepID=UPI0018DDFE5B|nr:hypothetical protein [Burkholderia plantarii]MBI0327412.1 hypothetical protein [Burkholderia plantarii]
MSEPDVSNRRTIQKIPGAESLACATVGTSSAAERFPMVRPRLPAGWIARRARRGWGGHALPYHRTSFIARRSHAAGRHAHAAA